MQHPQLLDLGAKGLRQLAGISVLTNFSQCDDCHNRTRHTLQMMRTVLRLDDLALRSIELRAQEFGFTWITF